MLLFNETMALLLYFFLDALSVFATMKESYVQIELISITCQMAILSASPNDGLLL